MRTTKITTTALVLALVPLAVSAQVPPEARARMDAAIAQAAQQGVPASLVESKIAEGLAKGVPAERIARATERRAAALVGARSAFAAGGVEAEASELALGADALQGGVSSAALTALAELAPADRRLAAIEVLRALVELDVPVAEAMDRVETALAGGPEALVNLPAQAAEAAARRGPPEGAGPDGRGPPDGVPAGGPPDDPRRGPPSGIPGGPFDL